MYVISLVTEYDVIAGRKYLVSRLDPTGLLYVTDDVGEEYALFEDEWTDGRDETHTLHARIEALQEEKADLKFRLDSLEK